MAGFTAPVNRKKICGDSCDYAVSLGADHKLWSRSQFVRMPDGLRDNGKRQVVFYFNPKVIK